MQVIEKDVYSCLEREGEDVGQHLELMKEMIRTQMKVGLTGDLGPGSRRVSNGLTNIRRATKVFGTKFRGHVGFVGCFCSEVC